MFPQPPEQHPDQTRQIYASQLLLYVLASWPIEQFGMMTDVQLELADQAAHRAVQGRDIEPKAADTLSEVRRRINRVMHARHLEREQTDQESRPRLEPRKDTPAGQDDRRDGGTREPRPDINPRFPAPAAAARVDEWKF